MTREMKRKEVVEKGLRQKINHRKSILIQLERRKI